MSSKHPNPKDPAKKKTTREDVINFMNYISTDENFCLRVWNTVRGVHERALKEAEAAKAAALNSGEAPIGFADAIAGSSVHELPEAVPA